MPLPPLALYLHLPWCVRKCPYCDFNSHAAPAELPEQRYVDALVADLAADLPDVGDRVIDSVFLGGGTPSLFAPASIAALLGRLREQVPFAGDVEITLEANPGTIERGRFEGYRAAGISRVSLGAQSFAPRQLTTLGRIHAAGDIGSAVAELRAAGIDNFNLDLMYALPEQTLAEALDDVDQAIALGPTHLSHYQLTLEPGTVFHHRPPPLPDDELAYAMQLACQARIAAAGYRHYEVSAYARAGHECRHNRHYWEFADYLGLGAGAHGKLTLGDGRIVRTERPKQPREYLERLESGRAVAQRRSVDPDELPFEFMLNALRLVDGCCTATFAARTGLSTAAIDATLERLGSRGLIERDGDRFRASPTGARFLNDVVAEFLPQAPRRAGAVPA